jgi:hypothetical protein
MDFAVQVCANMVAVGHHLPVGSVWGEALEIFYLQWLIGWPGWGANAEGNSEVDKFHEMLLFACSDSGSWLLLAE